MKEQSPYTFEGQRSDEDVIFVKKQHPWVLATAGFIGLGLIILLAVAILIWGLSGITSLLIVLVIIFALVYGGYRLFIYNSYLYILTNQRLILIEQKGLFSRRLSESELDKIQNIAVEVNGPIKTLLNFGNIKITTAGVDPVMVVGNVENPYLVQQEIIKYSKNQSLPAVAPEKKTIIR